MMINCPNCNLLQPKDQYCAQCGINMESWQPPQQPLWKKLIGNWMVQLGLLFLMIFGVVIWDSLSNQPMNDELQPLPPVAERLQRKAAPVAAQSDDGVAEFAPTRQSTPSPSTEKSEVALPTPTQKPQSETPAEAPSNLQKRMVMKIMAINRSAFEKLSLEARRIDDGVIAVGRNEGISFLNQNRKSFKGFGTIRKNFIFNTPMDLFWGEQDLETGANLGFFSQVIVDENSTPSNINVDVRFWYLLKMNGESGPTLTYSVSLGNQEALYILAPSIHDLEFNAEEVSLFEASSKLRGLNDETFVESLSDIALILEFK